MWQSDTAVCGFTVIFMNEKKAKKYFKYVAKTHLI